MDFLSRNNELVIDISSIESNLPDAIEGFFIAVGSGGHERSTVIGAHQAFLAAYRLDEAHAPPLVLLDLDSGGNLPFSLML